MLTHWPLGSMAVILKFNFQTSYTFDCLQRFYNMASDWFATVQSASQKTVLKTCHTEARTK